MAVAVASRAVGVALRVAGLDLPCALATRASTRSSAFTPRPLRPETLTAASSSATS